MRLSVLCAWAVHLYTATGLLLAAPAAVLILRGGPADLRAAFLLLFAAAAIDATDGWLARRLDVKHRLPGIDGRRLDDLIDFQTFTALPLLLLWQSGLLGVHAPWLLLPLLASAYGFAQTHAKTADGFFRGFPSYWNVIAFYLYFLQPSAGWALGMLVVFAVLTFVPAKYLYPSQPGRLNNWTLIAALPWAGMVLLVLLEAPAQPRAWVLASLYFPAYYLAASWLVTLRGLGGAGR